MPGLIPNTYKLPMKFNVFNLKYQQVQAQIIDKHTHAIQKSCTQPSVPPQGIESELFWTDLRARTANAESINALYDQWVRVKPLAHLSTKELIKLYQYHLPALERGYQYLLGEFPDVAIQQQIRTNMESITSLRQAIRDGLQYRAKIYQVLKSPSNVDDVYAAIITQINQLKSLERPLEVPKKLTSTLDDDRRIIIHDLLKMNNANDTVLKAVLAPFPKVGHAPILTQEQIQAKLDKFNTYRNQTIQQLALQGWGEYFFTMDKKQDGFKDLWNQGTNKLRELWNSLTISDYLSSIAIAMYTILCMLGVQYLLTIIQPVALFLVSQSTFALFSSIAFLTIGCAPLWFFGYFAVKNAFSWVHDYITCWKKQDILDALLVIEESKHFTLEKLSRVVQDIPRFDISELIKQVQECEKALDEAKSKLSRYYVGEKLVCQGAVQQQAVDAEKNIDKVKQSLHKHLNLLTCHISLRIGEDIEMVDKVFQKNAMEPLLPKKQLQRLREFVYSYGDEQAKTLFNKNANIIKKWVDKIGAGALYYADPLRKGAHQQPWGGYRVKDNGFKGWRIILDSFSIDPLQQHAAASLNDFLAGKQLLSLDQLREVISLLRVGDPDDAVLKIVQDYLFKTISARKPEYAALFSDEHKRAITQWRDQYQREIAEAKVTVDALFTPDQSTDQFNQRLRQIEPARLSFYFEILDGEDVFEYSTGTLTELSERNNKVRKFFEAYKGDTNLAFRLINFIPKKDQSEAINDFATKRLSWLLANLGQEVSPNFNFDENDTYLFKTINFADIFQTSKAFNENWTQERETFLRACVQNGIASDQLFATYVEKRPNARPILVQQPNESRTNPSQLGEGLMISPENPSSNFWRAYV